MWNKTYILTCESLEDVKSLLELEGIPYMKGEDYAIFCRLENVKSLEEKTKKEAFIGMYEEMISEKLSEKGMTHYSFSVEEAKSLIEGESPVTDFCKLVIEKRQEAIVNKLKKLSIKTLSSKFGI